MIDTTKLSQELKALLADRGVGDGELRNILQAHLPDGKALAPATFSAAMSGRISPKGRSAKRIDAAVRAYANEHGIKLAELVRQHLGAQRPAPQGNQSILSRLRGAWYLVQHRTIREVLKDEVAAPDLRLAILVFGRAVGATKLTFQIVGRSTLWAGEVHSHPTDRLLYYQATEREREGMDERLDLVTHEPFTAGKDPSQSGIILGVGHGEHNGSAIPIYASKVTLWRIDTPNERALVEPISNDEIERLRGYCVYIAADDIEAALATSETDPLMKERQDAIAHFQRSGRTIRNYGDRIFVEH